MLPDMQAAKDRSKKEVKFIYNAYQLSNEQKLLGKDKTYFIKTYGCQMNEHDSEKVKAMLEDMGFSGNDSYQTADLVILNTCAIRENAHDKVFGMLGRLKHLKNSNPNLIVGLCGCMAQEAIVVERLMAKYPWVNFIFGTHNLHELPSLLKLSIDTLKQQVDVWSVEGDVFENLPVKRDNPYKAWVNIMYGCDKFCTYCIVPMTRGKQRSRLTRDIVAEVLSLKEQGYQEITLLGQNVNAYGKDLNDNSSMASLLTAVSETNIPRIRFVTSHPWDFDEAMIKVIKKHNNIMPYIHLPVQSGSNKILKLMGRRYTSEAYLELFNKIKQALPHAGISTDIIVGFPGESEDDFQKTLDLYQACEFDIAYTFIYSPRVNTPAANMIDNVSEEIKNERLQRLNNLVNNIARNKNEAYLNQMVSVLLDSVSSKNKNYLSGYTETMKLVSVKANHDQLGKIVKVKITDAKTWSLMGEIIDE